MNRLREVRKLLNLNQTQIAQKMNLSQQAYGKIEKEQTIANREQMITLSKILNRPINYLFCLDDNFENVRKQGFKIPVLGTIPAGIPIEAITDILDFEEITEEMSKTGSYFALKVKGDSMMPTIQPNDVVILRQQDDAENGSICAIMVNGFDATLKKIKKDPNGIVLVPLNSNYEPMFFTNDEIITKPVKIIGKAVEIRRSLK